jgi:hypothetical protein
MFDADRSNVSALVPYLDRLPDPRTRIANRVPPRNPLTGVFQRIGDNTAARSFDSQASVFAALTRYLEQQTKAVEANDRLYNAIEQFHAHRLGLLNPADQERFDEDAHQRILAKKRREKEQYEADEQTLDVKHRLEAKVEFKDHKFAAGAARFAQKIAERQVGEAVARSSLEPEPQETPAPEKPVSIAAVLADFVQKLERDIDAAEAAGKPTKQMRDDLAAINAILKRV